MQQARSNREHPPACNIRSSPGRTSKSVEARWGGHGQHCSARNPILSTPQNPVYAFKESLPSSLKPRSCQPGQSWSLGARKTGLLPRRNNIVFYSSVNPGSSYLSTNFALNTTKIAFHQKTLCFVLKPAVGKVSWHGAGVLWEIAWICPARYQRSPMANHWQKVKQRPWERCEKKKSCSVFKATNSLLVWYGNCEHNTIHWILYIYIYTHIYNAHYTNFGLLTLD